MVSKSKWVEVESPDEPVTAVARRAVQGRLELVWRHLPHAAREADEEIEHVHQLRVSTRRAFAAMQIFDGLLPPSRKHWFRKQLKKVRRAAGDARDYDVLGLRLVQSCPENFAEACAAVVQRVRQHRQEAQEPISKMHAALAEKHFRHRIAAFVEKIRLRGKPAKRREPSVGCFAKENMQAVLEEFFEASSGDFSDTHALHQFRIEGKHLRYSMEVFAGAFEDTFRRDLYPLVEELQEKLGQINDHATARAQFQKWIDETDDPQQLEFLQELMGREVQLLGEKQGEFISWWTPRWAQELRQRFDQALESVHNC